MKELGFNTLRKHIKIEPLIFYYYCDKYGMAVFQDMMNNGKYSFMFDTVLPTIGFKRTKIGKATKIQKQVYLETAKKTLLNALFSIDSNVWPNSTSLNLVQPSKE